MIIRGKARVFGDDIDTDAIIPARYLNTSDPAELAQHCLEGAATGFPEKEKQGDIIIAGKNFGAALENTPPGDQSLGVGASGNLICRIFYRNAFNIGLPIFESPETARRFGKTTPSR